VSPSEGWDLRPPAQRLGHEAPAFAGAHASLSPSEGWDLMPQTARLLPEAPAFAGAHGVLHG